MGTNAFSMASLSLALAALAALPQAASAQQKPTLASVLDAQFTQAEKDFLSAAEAMPEEKYSFAPTNGEFKGVRTFAQQVKHVAVYNYRSFQAMLGVEITKDAENGSDAVKTKAENPQIRSRLVRARPQGYCRHPSRHAVE